MSERRPQGRPKGGAANGPEPRSGEHPSPPREGRTGGAGVVTDPGIERSVRRTVGIAALRRLRRMVDDESARDAQQSALATRLAWAFALAAAAAVAWIAFR